MERSRVILTDRDRQQQQQQQQERERQENHCIDTEQAVTKHFEESLRRAKEKQMRSAWTINAIPAPQQLQQQPKAQQPQKQQQQQPPTNLQHYFPPNQKTSSAASLPSRSVADKYAAASNEQRIFWPEIVSTPYFREKCNPPPPSSAQQFHHPAQIRQAQKQEYPPSLPQQQQQPPSHPPPPSSSQSHHREISITASQASPKILTDKRHIIKTECLPANQIPLYNATASDHGYRNAIPHKELKANKMEISLPNPSSLSNQQSVGVIVKYNDTSNKLNPIQLTHANVEKIHSHPIVTSQSQAKPHQVLQYKKLPDIVATAASAPNAPQKMPIFAHESYQQPFQHHTIQLPLAAPQKPSFSNFAGTVHQQQKQQQQSTPPLPAPLTAPAFLNAQTKPKVSSPAPSKIYGMISLSTDPIKPDMGLKSANPSQDRILTEPPPAHSHNHRSHQKYLLPQAPFDLATTTGAAAAAAAVVPMPISHSPGIHTPSPIPATALALSAPMIAATGSASTSSNSIALVDFQTKPLDLGIPDRHRNAAVNHHSPITRTASTSPSPAAAAAAKQQIVLNINTKSLPIPAATTISVLGAHDQSHRLALSVQSSMSNQLPTMKVPTITVTGADTIVPSVASSQLHHQFHPATAIIRTYEIDDTSNSSCNSKYENNGRTTDSTDQLTMPNGINNRSVPIAIAPTAVPTTKTYNNNGNGNDNQQRVNQSTPTPPPPAPQKNPMRTNSADGLLPSSSTNSSPAPSPNSAQSAPSTPAKGPNDYEKSASPVAASTAPRHLKKAWLQRHTTGEDGDSTAASILATSNTLSSSTPAGASDASNRIEPTNKTDSDNNSGKDAAPTTTATTTAPAAATPTHSINTTSKHPINNSANRRPVVSPTRASRTKFDLDKQNDSSSSDQSSSVQKSVPKRKIPKGKRRKIGLRKKNHSTSIGSGGTAEASDSDRESGDSDKESMSDKESDSTGTIQSKPHGLNGAGAAAVAVTTAAAAAAAATATNSNDGVKESKVKYPKDARGKRSRRPKDDIYHTAKKRKQSSTNDPFRKPPLSQLKRTGESFLQDGPCFAVAPKLAKCRECRWTANQRSKNTSNIFCRFYAFRKLRYTKTGQLAISGFCDPHKDPTEDELRLWMPDADNPPRDLDLAQARFLLAKVADQFCDLYVQEKMATPENMAGNQVVAWKRVIQGVREMCDVCETSLFNYHWACSKCGFVVCLDCYKARKYGEIKVWNNEWNNGGDRDEFQWLLCTNRSAHDQKRLMLTQIIAGDSLQKLGRRIHHVRALWKIPQNCDCLMSRLPPKATNGSCKQIIESILNDQLNRSDREFSSSDSEATNVKKENAGTPNSKAALNLLAQVALKTEDIKKESIDTASSPPPPSLPPPPNAVIKSEKTAGAKDLLEPHFDDDDNSSEGSSLDENQSTLRDLLIGPASKSTVSSPTAEQQRDDKVMCDSDKSSSHDVKPAIATMKTPKKSHLKMFDEMMADTLEKATKRRVDQQNSEDAEIDDFSNQPRRNRYLPPRVMTMALSTALFPNVKHMWLCDGRLLRLLDPSDPNNLKIFQQQWKRGQPVMVSHLNTRLNMELWRPESFSRDFGEDANDLVNCLTGTLVPNQPMKRFWDGFDYINKRIKDNKGEPMLLKLKDWPPGEDFAETLPTRFTDLMKSLPLPDYTKRNGKFNLASRLPDCFVKPDLGPKMYNAYGSACHPTKGTTNLHLDISDAVNVMVYVGIPKDTENIDDVMREAYRAVDEAGCDLLQRRRVREKNELPGALWHIFAPRDANKIRDLLNKVAIERGERLEPNHDAIHDQSWYLDYDLRQRLYKEYGVEGYPIAQCLGDAVFIPAGAPHQVRNLLNCIKVAEDFVSPENVSECFNLTHEFRALSDTHSNHEDKLQIKNVIYHTVKDALSVLSHVLGECIAKEQGYTEDDTFEVKQEIKEEPTSGDEEADDGNDIADAATTIATDGGSSSGSGNGDGDGDVDMNDGDNDDGEGNGDVDATSAGGEGNGNENGSMAEAEPTVEPMQIDTNAGGSATE